MQVTVDKEVTEAVVTEEDGEVTQVTVDKEVNEAVVTEDGEVMQDNCR